MIAAVGRVPVGELVSALRLMASNRNELHHHEFRERGSEFVHDCGWGVARERGGPLLCQRSPRSCLDDDSLAALSGLETHLVVLHARRTPDRETIAIENSHPFLADFKGELWAFCHNGSTEDVSGLSSAPGLTPGGTTDSELLFHHVLEGIDPSDRARSLADTMGPLHGFTCLNSFLATADRVTVYSRAAPATTTPLYYTLWRGGGRGLELVSSEPCPLEGVSWEPVPAGACFELNIDS